MNIGEAAQATGITAKMIRYYEDVGLVPPPGRSGAGYREYSASDLHRLKFIRRARDLGFSMPDIRDLLALWSEKGRSNADVRSVAQRHIAGLERQAAHLAEMIATLRGLVQSCRRGGRPHCPILVELGAGSAVEP